jgi:predicted RNase H-like nuclease
MNFIGLDVGFSSRKRSSGVARLNSGVVSVGCATASLESRTVLFGVDEVDLAAIDAPILGRDSYDKRACERLFTLGCFQRRCKPGLSHVPGTGRAFRQAGHESARQLSEISSGRELLVKFPRVWGARNLIEAFPNAFMGVLLPGGCFDQMPKLRRGRKFEWLYNECRERNIFDSVVNMIGTATLRSILQHIKSNQNHDQKAALICLLTAAAVTAGRYTAVGDPAGGYFFLPPWEAWAPWARQEVETQRRRMEPVEMWIDGVRFRQSEPLPSVERGNRVGSLFS